MTKLFDPVRKREVAPSMLARDLVIEFDESLPMGNFASHLLADCVCLMLVGIVDEIPILVSRANKWLDIAIEIDEQFGGDQNGHRMTLHRAKAIGHWMEFGRNHEGEWEQARIFMEALWQAGKRPWSENQIIKDGLDDYMACAFQGGGYNDGFEVGIEMYERWTGVKEVSLRKILKPRDFGYALCLHYARQQFDPDELYAAGRRLLKVNLQSNWFGYGQYNRGVIWLKIVHSLGRNDQRQPLTPREIILKAYDDMPDVLRPEGV